MSFCPAPTFHLPTALIHWGHLSQVAPPKLIITDKSSKGAGLLGPAEGATMQMLAKGKGTPFEPGSFLFLPFRPNIECGDAVVVRIQARPPNKASANSSNHHPLHEISSQP